MAFAEWSENAAAIPAAILAEAREMVSVEVRLFDPSRFLAFLLPHSDVRGFLHGLEQVISFLEHSTEHASTARELVQAIERQTRDLTAAVWHVKDLIGEVGTRSADEILNMPVAVDFHEVYSYVFWAFQAYGNDFLSPYIFRPPRCRYYLLPGAYRELLHYLLRLSSSIRFLDEVCSSSSGGIDRERHDERRLVHSVGAILKSAAPLDRLKSLLKHGVLLPYPVDPRIQRERRFQGRFEQACYHFKKIRPFPNRILPNRNDALDLAILACLRENGEPITLLTSVVSASLVVKLLELPVLEHALRSVQQQAFLLYMRDQEQQTGSPLLSLSEGINAKALEHLEYLSEVIKKLPRALDAGDIQTLLQSKRRLVELQSTVGSFHEDVFEQLIVPFCAELSALANEESTKHQLPIMKMMETIQYHEIRTVVGQTIGDLIGLLVPLDKGYRAIFEGLGSSESQAETPEEA